MISNNRYIDKIYFPSSHTLIANLLSNYPPRTKILDVGCATGTLGRMLIGSGLILDGIELNSDYAEKAKLFYDKIIINQMDMVDTSFIANHSVIVFADVLEHHNAPEVVLRHYVKSLRKGSDVIISVPNIANIYVRLSLLFGIFNYHDRGILDRTHLRFFTRQTFKELVSKSGLQINSIFVTPIPWPLIIPKLYNIFIFKLFAHSCYFITKLLPKILGYQFVIKAKMTYDYN